MRGRPLSPKPVQVAASTGPPGVPATACTGSRVTGERVSCGTPTDVIVGGGGGGSQSDTCSPQVARAGCRHTVAWEQPPSPPCPAGSPPQTLPTFSAGRGRGLPGSQAVSWSHSWSHEASELEEGHPQRPAGQLPGGVCSSQPHAPPTPGATAGGGLALAGGCFPVRHGPVPVGQAIPLALTPGHRGLNH